VGCEVTDKDSRFRAWVWAKGLGFRLLELRFRVES
jgi:hypothetical protein